MSTTTVSLVREFCKTLTVDPSRCLYASTNRTLCTASRHRRRENAHSRPCSRRLLHTTTTRASEPVSGKGTPEDDLTQRQTQRKLKDDLRALLRDVAQPVAVVTSFMPSDEHPSSSSAPSTPSASESGLQAEGSRYHGATLSSFTSIAMDPYPLIAFALRIPSRMATSLSGLVAPSPSSPDAASLSSSSSSTSLSSSTPPSSQLPPSSTPSAHSQLTSHMVINLLSASQSSEAITFSRPDLHPTPFASSPSTSSSAPSSTSSTTNSSSRHESDGVKYTLSPDGLPILHGVVGALSCRLVGPPIPLHNLNYLARMGAEECQPAAETVEMKEDGAVTSELFIAQVVRVESVGALDESLESEIAEEDGERGMDGERTLPLIYYRQGYTSCSPIDGGKGS